MRALVKSALICAALCGSFAWSGVHAAPAGTNAPGVTPDQINVASGVAGLNTNGQLTKPLVVSVTNGERASNATTNFINDFFVGTGSTTATGTNADFWVANHSSGQTRINQYMGVDNFVDATYQIPGYNIPANVARFSQYTRPDSAVNWQNGAVPSQGWGIDAVANDLILWGSAGYPAFPPAGANLQHEFDTAVVGPDHLQTRTVIAADCKVATVANANTYPVECDSIYSGANGFLLSDGVTKQVHIWDIFKTGYNYWHSAFNNLGNTGEPGSRAIWLGANDKIAYEKTGQTASSYDPLTRGLQLAVGSGGNLQTPVITNGGSGYTYCAASVPNGLGNGGGVYMTCTVSGGQVTAIAYDFTLSQSPSGNDFTSTPAVTITGDGTGATATVARNGLYVSPIGAGMAVYPRVANFNVSSTIPAYELGWPINWGGTAAGTLTLPTYSTSTTYGTGTRTTLVTPIENLGTAPVTVVSATTAIENYTNGIVLQPYDKVWIMLDPLGVYRVVAWARASSSVMQKLTAIPTSGPGAGLFAEYIVPSNLTTPAGTSGACSKIAMAGTSATYTIEVASVGGGC